MSPHGKILICIAFLCMATVLLAGCITAQPELAILSPQDNAVVNGSSVTVTVAVMNFKLVDKIGQANVPGEGHLVYFLDIVPPTDQGLPVAAALERTFATTETTYAWENVGVGQHVLGVELVNNDDTPLNPPVSGTVTVMLQQPGLTACTQPSDCVPAQCCHPTSCINKDYKEVCTVFCTASCEGPIDCGAGTCGCVNGQCGVIPSNLTG
ncbi:hypothetical protein J2741_000361 [Methanolinea mesophila]|uniref:hypothetical protein n=1 Tax=Methanolinea mesophila TaxID=547055 RepID=UPI001AE51946|nr:hypothetical protein [Methanolinea mesophila]MBP1927814.1 hypothetical protein [Methanolinea mesophila]